MSFGGCAVALPKMRILTRPEVRWAFLGVGAADPRCSTDAPGKARNRE